MSGLKDIVSFLLPIPPLILMRNNQFPNCPAVFEDISHNPSNPRALGRIFSRLCSLSGFSWLVWGINAMVFSVVVIVLLYHWGNRLDMSEPSYVGVFSCQQVIAILAAMLFVGELTFHGAVTICFQLSDRCYEHVQRKSKVTTRTGQKG